MQPDKEKIALPVGVTLDRFIKRNEDAFPYATGELSQLLRDIALAAKIVNREVNRAGLAGVTGLFGADNVQGEHQQKLDVIAHVRFLRALRNGGEVAAVVSEEEDDVLFTGNESAKYVVAIDPLVLFSPSTAGKRPSRLRPARRIFCRAATGRWRRVTSCTVPPRCWYIPPAAACTALLTTPPWVNFSSRISRW
jgi:hypothetical protein